MLKLLEMGLLSLPLMASELTLRVAEQARYSRQTNEDSPAVSVTLQSADFAGAGVDICRTLRQAANLVHPEGALEAPSYGCHVYTGEGMRVLDFEGLVDGAMYYTYPEDRPFIWPTVEVGHKFTMPFSDDDERADRSGIVLETLCQKPRIFRIHNFVSEEETDSLIARAQSLKLERSTGGLQKQDAEGDNQGEVVSDRTSTNAWDQSSPDAQRIKRRAMDLLRLEFDDDWTDGLQVVRYEPPQFYNSHEDHFDIDASPGWNWDPSRGGVNRLATVFLYLNDVEMGGETVFPNAEQGMEANTHQQEEYEDLRDTLMTEGQSAWALANQCRSKFRVTPKRGDAILFYGQTPGGGLDPKSLHGACPVLKGVKWGANLWIWNNASWDPYKEDGYYEEKAIEDRADYRKIEFLNSASVDLTIYWVSDSGELVDMGPVLVGLTSGLNSHVGHTFAFLAADGSEVAPRHTVTTTHAKDYTAELRDGEVVTTVNVDDDSADQFSSPGPMHDDL